MWFRFVSNLFHPDWKQYNPGRRDHNIISKFKSEFWRVRVLAGRSCGAMQGSEIHTPNILEIFPKQNWSCTLKIPLAYLPLRHLHKLTTMIIWYSLFMDSEIYRFIGIWIAFLILLTGYISTHFFPHLWRNKSYVITQHESSANLHLSFTLNLYEYNCLK